MVAIPTRAGGRTVLRAHDLSKRYGERHALRAVSFAAAEGELLAVVGPNGAGKTTLLGVLAGFLHADEGRVVLPESGVGWVPQEPAIYGKLTVEENLRLFARLERVPDVATAVADMLGLIGLGARRGEPAGRLSGGNRQRLNLAIGLLARPAVLLLDEPSSALDARQRGVLWTFLRQLTADGTTVLYTSHDAVEVERHADRVLALADGELLFGGTPGELGSRSGGAGGDFEAAFLAFLEAHGH